MAVHTGSIAGALEPGASVVEALLEVERDRGTATVSFDPNCRPVLMGDPRAIRAGIVRLVTLSDVVEASDEDLRRLYGERPFEDVAASWLDLVASLVVTRGGRGSFAAGRAASVTRTARLPLGPAPPPGRGRPRPSPTCRTNAPPAMVEVTTTVVTSATSTCRTAAARAPRPRASRSVTTRPTVPGFSTGGHRPRRRPPLPWPAPPRRRRRSPVCAPSSWTLRSAAPWPPAAVR
ncbi:hypothetical protein ACFQ1B_00705 [Streptomyces mexicanus]